MTPPLELAHPPGRIEERRYAAEALVGEVALREEARSDVELRLRDGEGGVRFADGLFATAHWLEPESLPHAPSGERGGTTLLYPDDPFGSAFFLLTGYGDIVTDARDAHGRHPASGSPVADLLDRPLVDEYRDLVWDELLRTWPRLERPRRAPRVLPSHDVDWPHSPERGPLARLRRAAGSLHRGDAGEAAVRVAALLRGRDPNDTFDAIMEASERRGLRSAFYFIAGGTAPRDGDYDLRSEPLQRLLRRVHERGHEIGLHGSYATMDDPELLAQELATLRAACASAGVEQDRWGGRQHYLRFDPAVTWRGYEEAGLDYDTSAGYADRAGFRLGTSHELPVFDVVRGRRLSLRERPLVAMEVSLLDHAALTVDAAAARLRELKRSCLAHGGDFTLLWHNSRLVSPRERRLYEEALDA